tara:strand:- start:2558 stop:2767 length:210 start_codon:yes stop_codon:yes gene_type:complete
MAYLIRNMRSFGVSVTHRSKQIFIPAGDSLEIKTKSVAEDFKAKFGDEVEVSGLDEKAEPAEQDKKEDK